MVTRREQNYARSFSAVCPHCGSKIVKSNGVTKCSMDQYDFWRKEIEIFNQMTIQDQNTYLDSIQNTSKTTFLHLVKNIETFDCGFSLNITNLSPNNSTRVPDPFQVNRLEKKLGRELTELEREEGFVFKLKDEIYTLDFLNYPDEM